VDCPTCRHQLCSKCHIQVVTREEEPRPVELALIKELKEKYDDVSVSNGKAQRVGGGRVVS
jgi:hypothetical protein